MRILLIGSGGRESALAWKMAKSELVNEVIVSPGNPGMKKNSSKITILPDTTWVNYLELKPDLVVVGPEIPLLEGIVDFFESHNVSVLGPSQTAANLEGSKIFCKMVMKRAGIPTADYVAVESIDDLSGVLSNWKKETAVVKVDELAQGKGVIVAGSKDEAEQAAHGLFSGEYLGTKAKKILIEERLDGEEVSAFALCDGENFIILGSATDYKRLLNDDQGPNTGGMGTISPSPILSEWDEKWISDHVFAPTLKTMKELGHPFKGFLFAGLMKTADGFKVLEFNTRLGDPETQSLLPRIQDDIVPHFLAAAHGELELFKSPKTSGTAIHIVLAAAGYPGVNGISIQRGDEVSVHSLDKDTLFFPAGVSEKGGKLVSSGGRICGITSLGSDLNSARLKVYQEIKKIDIKGAQYRNDIGAKFL